MSDHFRQEIKHLYLPTPISSVVFILLVGFILVIPHPPERFEILVSPVEWWIELSADLSDREIASKVFEALIVIIIALIIFVAESIRNSRNAEQKRVLLRISNLWPLVLLSTLAPLGYFYSKPTGLTIVLALMIAALTVFAFYGVIHMLISIDAQEAAQLKLLKERIHSIILDSVRERVGNKILFDLVGSDKTIKLDYVPSKSWLRGNSEQYVFIDAAANGLLADINLVELAQLAELLNRIEQELRPTPEAGERSDVTAGPRNVENEAPKSYFFRRYREFLPPDSIFSARDRTVLALPKVLARNQDLIEEVRARSRDIFWFRQTNSSSDAFRREMQATKDHFVSAIRSISLGTIDVATETYRQIAEEFLTTLHELGGGYSAEQARQERGTFFEGWNEIRWLTEDIRELLTVAVETANTDVIKKISFLPHSIAIRAIQASDHLLFEEFLEFTTFIYSLAKSRVSNSDVGDFMIDRSWRYLKELSEFHVEHALMNDDLRPTPEKIFDLRDFALHVLKLFQNLLKTTSDKDDIATFREVLPILRRQFHNFIDEPRFEHVNLLEQQLENARSDSERLSLEVRIATQKAIDETKTRLISAKEEIFFGLGASYLARLLNSAPPTTGREFYDEILNYLPRNLADLTNVFARARQYKVSDFWGWGWWDRIPDGEVRVVDSHSNLNHLFCVRALQLLANLNDDAIQQLRLPHGEPLAELVDDANPHSAVGTINSIRANPEKWKDIIAPLEFGRLDALVELLRDAKAAVERTREDRLMAATLAPEKLDKFRRNVVDGFTRFGRLRPLMNLFGAVLDRTLEEAGRDVLSWGYNQLDQKGAFITDWHISYGSWGDSYGRGLAQAEDQRVFSTMIEAAAVRATTDISDLIPTIETNYNSTNMKGAVILHSLASSLEYEDIRGKELFVPRYRDDCPTTRFNSLGGFQGILNVVGENLPVFNVFVTDNVLRNKVLIVDLSRYVRWEQYSHIDERGEGVNVNGFVFVHVSDLNTDNFRRERVIAEDPTWLRDKPDKGRFLRTHVVVNIYERFKIEVVENAAAICLSVTNSIEFD